MEEFGFRAAKEMAIVLKSWVGGKEFLTRQAELIPDEITPQKLVKDLSKQVAFVDKTALAENPVAPPQRPQVRGEDRRLLDASVLLYKRVRPSVRP